jgi:hypothetical protein
VAEEWGEHRGSDVKQLHDTGDHDFGQRVGVPSGGDEYGGDGDERSSDTDGESGPSACYSG